MVILLACAQPETDTSVSLAPEAVLGGETVVFTNEEVVFDAGTSVGDSFTWDFGDGSTDTSDTPRHTFDTPGRYTVRLTAVSADGRTDTASGTWVVVNEPIPPGFVNGSGRVAYLDGTVYAVVPDADELVTVVDGAVVERISTCGHPEAASVRGVMGASILAVACRDDAVEFFDTRDMSALGSVALPWGSRPAGVLATADGAVMALAGSGKVVHVTTYGTIEDVADLPDARGLAVWNEVIYASRFRSPDTGGVGLRIGETTTDFSFPLDPGPDSDTDARGLPTLLDAVAVRPDGKAVVFAGSKANIQRGLQRDGLPYTFETATRSALRLVDAQTGEQLARALFDNRDVVGAVAFTPLGDKLLVAHQGAGVVDILDPYTLTRLGGFQEVGIGLDGVATDGSTAWVLSSLTRELVAYDLSDLNAETELYRVPLVDEDPLDPQLLLGAQVFHFSGDPRMSTDAYLSCASCHPDGGNDGRTWDFTDRGEGFRDTQALFAMPSAGPFHWSANFDEVQDFENPIRATQEGAGFLSDADFAATEDPLGEPKEGLSEELDALAAYVRSFAADRPRSPYREEDGSATAAGERGATVFLAQGCDTCHSGAEYTDAAWNEDGSPVLHDIGTILPTSGYRIGETLTGLRTPSLRGLFATAPYLHDGRATLAEAVAAHGVTLSPEDEADLLEYLLEIE